MPDCPSQADLDRYHAGEMEEHAAAELRAHFDNCPECAARDASLVAAHESLLAKLRGLTLESVRQDESPTNRTQTAPASSQRSRTRPPVVIRGYEIIDELSHGGQGVVFRARQKSTNRDVAIKILLEGAYASDAARKRFQREVELAAQLKHPNVITIFDSGTTEDGLQYCVMDFVEGLPLHKFARAKELGLEETLKLFSMVCDAIEHAHGRGVIHRDLKPSNILVTREGRPRILDFGLAKLLEPATGSVVSFSQDVVGTLPYMSPEQAQGRRDAVDTCTDVYALGIMLYELLTGKFPYPVNGQMSDVLRHIIETPPAPPRRQWHGTLGVKSKSSVRFRSGSCPIDRDVQTILFKALEKEPDRRYASAAALSEDLSRYLQHEPILARPPSVAYRILKRIRRNRRLTVFATLTLVAIAIAVVLGWRLTGARLQLRYSNAEGLVKAAALAYHTNPESAIELCDQALDLWPDCPHALIQRALSLRFLGRDEQAIAAAKEIIERVPTEAAPGHLLLAQLYKDLQPELAEQHRRLAESLAPGDPYFRALALDSSRADEAIALLTDVLRQNRLNFGALWARAWLHKEREDWSAMLNDAEELVLRWPDTAAYWNAKGIALSRLGRFEEAVAAYDQSIRLLPREARFLINRAETKLNAKDYAGAVRDCTKAIDLGLEEASAYAVRAESFFHMKRYGDANADFSQAEALGEQGVMTSRFLCDYGHCRLKAGDFPKALLLYEQGMADGFGRPHDLHNRARLYRLHGDYDSALRDHDAALRDNPESTPMILSRGLTLRMMGRLDEAERDFEKAARMDPTWKVQALLWIWEMRSLAGDSPAVAALQAAQAAAADPSDRHIVALCSDSVIQPAADEPIQNLYYWGLRKLIEGDRSAAMTILRKVIRSGQHTLPEFDLATYHLKNVLG